MTGAGYVSGTTMVERVGASGATRFRNASSLSDESI